jgi:predicted RND superfamily exporter protein
MVLIGCIGLAGLAVHQIADLNVDTNSIGFLSPDHRAQIDSKHIETTFGPYVPLEFVLQLETADDASSEQVFAQIEQLQQHVRQRVALLGDSFSYVNAWVARSTIEEYAPDADVHGFEPNRWIDEQRTHIRVNWTVPMASARELAELKEQVLKASEDVLPTGMILTATGYLPLYSQLIDRVITDQVRSLAVALVVVFALIALLLRDIRVFVIALCINLLPILLLLASMSLLDIPLDVATITVAPAMLGLIVDDSIHLLYHYQRRRKGGLALEPAVLANARTVGRTLVLTSFVLVIGFGVLGFSAMSSLSINGLLMAWTVILALGADLFLLPAVAASLEPTPRFSHGQSSDFSQAGPGRCATGTRPGIERVIHHSPIAGDATPPVRDGAV